MVNTQLLKAKEVVNPIEPKCLKFPSEPPEWDWQHRVECIVSQAEEILWSDMGQPALNYLMELGLTTRTIRAARLGYVPGDFRQWRVIEGLDVPCGITISWFAKDIGEFYLQGGDIYAWIAAVLEDKQSVLEDLRYVL